jgi:hypothetical protein
MGVVYPFIPGRSEVTGLFFKKSQNTIIIGASTRACYDIFSNWPSAAAG